VAYTNDEQTSADKELERILRRNEPAWTQHEQKTITIAYQLMMAAHTEQRRASGEPYAIHPLAVAQTVTSLGMDADSVAAALLHDTVEDTALTVEDITGHVGPSIAHIVDGVTKLDKVADTARRENPSETVAASLQKMLVAATSDARVLVVKLADRLHNIATLQWLSPQKQKRVAEETLSVYVPLAHRLGMDVVRAQLEDIAFRTINPDMYTTIANHIAATTPQREHLLANAFTEISRALKRANIEATVEGRTKTVYSVYRKMVARQVPLDRVDDLVGVRIICENLEDPYRILGVVHSIVTPVPGRVRDYIASPKFNMYRSLHTTARFDNSLLEVQIRTWGMHSEAELGVAAHWRYRSQNPDVADSATMPIAPALPWLGKLAEQGIAVADPDQYLAELRADLAAGEMIIFGTAGEMYTIPDTSTVAGLATTLNLPEKIVGAKVNGVWVNTRTRLRPGDTINLATGPARNTNTPAVAATNPAGRLMELLPGAPSDWTNLVDVDTVAAIFNQTPSTLIEEIAADRIPAAWVEVMITELCDPTHVKEVDVDNLGQVPVVAAPCCGPTQGDPVLAALAGNVAVVHKTGCPRMVGRHLVDVDWSAPAPVTATVAIAGVDRPGFLADISAALCQVGLNVHEHTGHTGVDRVAHLTVVMGLSGHTQLSIVADILTEVPGVFDVNTDNAPDAADSATSDDQDFIEAVSAPWSE
jgi:guanosine-3',5'-bis(diphosphate) 3'-pyrophosphohydrolase